MSERQTKAGNQECYYKLKKLFFMSMLKSHSHTLSVSHSCTLNMLNNFCFHVYAQKSLSHSFTTFATFTIFTTFTLSFTLSQHAEQVLFSSLCSKVAVYSRKMQ